MPPSTAGWKDVIVTHAMFVRSSRKIIGMGRVRQSGMTRARISRRQRAMRPVSFVAAAGLVFALGACFNTPEYLIPLPVPEPEDVVGAWVNPDDGGRIDFRADGTCGLFDIPEGALALDFPGPDGKPTGQRVSTEDCTWRVDEDDPHITLVLEAQKRSTMLAVRGYEGAELGFWLGDPDQRNVYPLEKQPAT